MQLLIGLVSRCVTCRALFATHHHNLAEEAALSGALTVAHMVTRFEGGAMIAPFLLRPGPAPQVSAVGLCGCLVHTYII